MKIATVYLTERNLLTLLNKLADEGSSKQLIKTDTGHAQFPCTHITRVVAVKDEDYYTDREPGPVKKEHTP